MGSHWMFWICQKPGKGLESIGYIERGGGTYFAQSLQGQFSITKDSSKNMLYLQSLTSSESVVEKPGKSVTLSCSVSGISMGSYWMQWIRQKPGKGLEWIGYIDGGTRTYFAQSLQGQFSITKDTNTYGQSLTSSESVVEKPGKSVTLSCSVSGFSMGSYWMHWIRQKPRKGLESIGYIERGGGTYFAQSLQGQFSITKDTSKNMLYLQVKSLKAEDTAVYYCVRDRLTQKGCRLV
ncbi:hypothetical protein MHYP_G00146120 [Metynnis hypsauchen]